MRRTRMKPTCNLQVDVYRLVAEAVEVGIEAGLRRAHKHTDSPTQEGIKQEIDKEIMNRLCEIFIFPERC